MLDILQQPQPVRVQVHFVQATNGYTMAFTGPERPNGEQFVAYSKSELLGLLDNLLPDEPKTN